MVKFKIGTVVKVVKYYNDKQHRTFATIPNMDLKINNIGIVKSTTTTGEFCYYFVVLSGVNIGYYFPEESLVDIRLEKMKRILYEEDL